MVGGENWALAAGRESGRRLGGRYPTTSPRGSDVRASRGRWGGVHRPSVGAIHALNVHFGNLRSPPQNRCIHFPIHFGAARSSTAHRG